MMDVNIILSGRKRRLDVGSYPKESWRKVRRWVVISSLTGLAPSGEGSLNVGLYTRARSSGSGHRAKRRGRCYSGHVDVCLSLSFSFSAIYRRH